MSSRNDEELIGAHLRTHVLERDGHVCRLCGVFAQVVHVHHIQYRSQGGADVPSNLVSLDWKCHDRVHRNKPLWMPLLVQVAVTNGVNGLQLLRWYEGRAHGSP